MELTKLQTETQQLKDKMALFEKYYPVSPRRGSYDKIERFDNGNVSERTNEKQNNRKFIYQRIVLMPD